MAFMHLRKATFSGEKFSNSGGSLSIGGILTKGGSLTADAVESIEDDEIEVSAVIT